MVDTEKAMRLLLAVVESRSLAAAADRMKLSRASATRLLAQLEERLSSRLLNRTSRQMSLTEAGKAYIDYSRQILELVEEAEHAVGSARQEPRGVLRVCAPAVFGAHYVAAAIPLYLERYPHIRVDLELHDREITLVEEGFDLAVRVTSRLDSSLIAAKVTDCPIVTCAAPSYLERWGAPSKPVDLKQHNCLFYSRDHANAWSFFRQGKAHHITVDGSFCTNSGSALLAAGLRGLGIIRLSSFHVHQAIADGTLVPLLTNYQGDDQGIYIVYQSRKFQPLKVRTFIDFLTTHLRSTCDWKIAWRGGEPPERHRASDGEAGSAAPRGI